MDFLTQQNKLLSGEMFPDHERVSAEGKRVIILGGGDTGADCLATAHRQGAEIVRQFEIVPQPPEKRPGNNPWPYWPLTLRRSCPRGGQLARFRGQRYGV
jgi:NADPH-dependent glutamate synthase beta subunit-like oxidoreductase